jgi:beta-glucosidase
MVRWTGTVRAPVSGAYIISIKHDDGGYVYMDGEAFIEAPQSGSESKVALLEADKEYEIVVEMVEYGGDAVLEFGWKLPDGSYISPEDLEEVARTADAVVIMSGTSHFGDGRTRESEMGDRNSILPPLSHMTQIPRYLKLNPHTVVVNLSGNPVHYPWAEEMPAFVQYWYAGQEGGNALANVLFGEVNPSGKLPFSVPFKLKDSPAHHIEGNWSGEEAPHKEGVFIGYRWYQQQEILPQFAFGHGLSYTAFQISQLRLSKKAIGKNESVTATVEVKNTGEVEGAEVLQFYIEDVEARVERPQYELKAFEKVTLSPGETQTVEITFNPRDFSFWDVDSHGWLASFIIK